MYIDTYNEQDSRNKQINDFFLQTKFERILCHLTFFEKIPFPKIFSILQRFFHSFHFQLLKGIFK